MKPVVVTGHAVRLRMHRPNYSKPWRFTASWVGWPSDDFRRVRRTLPGTEPEIAMQAAAKLFVDWFNAGSRFTDPARDYSLSSITAAYDGRNEWMMIVRIKRDT